MINFRIILIVLFVVCKHTMAQDLVSSEKLKTIDEIFKTYQEQPGCAVGIFKNGRIIYEKGFGLANLDYNIPITKKTVFDIASASKQFTAACIFLLESEGKLNLDDPIQKYVPEIPEYSIGTITIKNLIHHTNGLRDYLAVLHSKGISWNSNIDNKTVLQTLSKQKGINFKPNSRHLYTNSSYALLSIIVERVSGKTLGIFSKEKLFDPLQMNNTFYYEDKSAVIKNRAIGYQSNENNFSKLHYFNAISTGDGGVYTTVEDFFKWSENFKTMKVGGKTLIENMLTRGILANGNEIEYAGGLFIGNYRNIEGLETLGHSGNWAGFNSLFFKFIDQDIAFVILSNNANTNVWEHLNQLVPLFLEQEIKDAQTKMNSNPTTQTIIPSIQVSKKELELFTGHFYNTTNGATRTILIKNDTLIYRRSNGRETKLLPVAKDQFVFNEAPFVKLNFNRKSYEYFQLVINNDSPINFSKYSPKEYTSEELKKYQGNYTSEELEVTYEIKPLDKGLQILINSEELVRLNQVSQNIFNDVHFGYLKFNINEKGEITGFIRNDDIIMNIKFTKNS